MRRSPVGLETVADWHNLAAAFHRVAIGKRSRPEVQRFAANLDRELAGLRREILAGTVAVGRMRRFRIRDPKPRIIHAPCFRERVLHHAPMAHVGPVLDRALVDDTYACRVGKGALAAVGRARYHVLFPSAMSTPGEHAQNLASGTLLPLRPKLPSPPWAALVCRPRIEFLVGTGRLMHNRAYPSMSIENIMANPAQRDATYEDVLRAPQNLVAELLNGRLHTHPRPSPRHAFATSSLDEQLFGPFGRGRSGPGGWWILVEPEVHLGSQVAVPDLAGWRRERMPELPDDAWIALTPDWVCEILSPSTAQSDRTIKLPVYAEHGVLHCWLIDPVVKTLEAYELKGGKWTLLATLKEDDTVRLPPFAAIDFSLDTLWP